MFFIREPKTDAVIDWIEPSSTVPDPDHSSDEGRYLIFGVSRTGKFLVVSYTERVDRIRLISARTMTGRERKAYEQ